MKESNIRLMQGNLALIFFLGLVKIAVISGFINAIGAYWADSLWILYIFPAICLIFSIVFYFVLHQEKLKTDALRVAMGD